MRHICLTVLILFSFILQSKVAVLGVSLNLTALAAYYCGISSGTTRGLFLGSLIGLLEDGAGGGIIGPNMLGKGMVGFFSSFISAGLFRWTPYIGMLAVFVLTAMDVSVVFLSKSAFGTTPAPLQRMFLVVLIQGLVNSMAGLFLRTKNAD